MDKATQRLNRLFLNNESLLEKDTGLRLSVSSAKPGVLYNNSPNVANKNRNLPHSHSPELPVDNHIVAPSEADALQIRLNHVNDNGGGDEFDERTAFQSGLEASPFLVAHSFCPAAAIMKLPYKYMRGTTAGVIARRFFDKGQFWAREWDL